MAFSKLEKAMGAIIGIDLLAPGTTRAAAGRLAMIAARTIAPVTVPAAQALGPITPVAVGAGLGYAALQTDPGQELLAAAAERGRQDRLRLERYIQDTLALGAEKKKRKKSTFNQQVKAGMKAVKASTKFGKKGTISNAKRAFSAVTKIASRVRKGKKVSRKGYSGVIARAVKKPKWVPVPRGGR